MADDPIELSKDENRIVLLTTVDNPFNPHTQFDSWNAYDQQLGHHTSALLARVVVSSEHLPFPSQALAIEEAIDDLVENNPSGLLRKIVVNG